MTVTSFTVHGVLQLVVTHLVKKCLTFVDPKVSLPCSQSCLLHPIVGLFGLVQRFPTLPTSAHT
jgi:hypothetical protein